MRNSSRRLVLAICLISAAIFAVVASRKDQLPSYPENDETITGSKEQLHESLVRDRFLDLMFPRHIPNVRHAYGYTERGEMPGLTTATAARLYHSHSINTAGTHPVTVELSEAPLDSFWAQTGKSDEQFIRFLEAVQTGNELLEQLTGAEVSFRTALEKALFQRDIVTIAQMANKARHLAREENQKIIINRFYEKLIALVSRLSLKAHELQEVHRHLLKSSASRTFARTCTFDLNEDYMPPVVWGPTSGWFEFPSDESSRDHFDGFGGRCFIKAYSALPGFSEEDFYNYWVDITDKSGPHPTRTSGLPPLPEGTQTVLIRTFGVFLDDGSFADSQIPEEVILRIFKHREPKIDMTTSDFLGTLFYQYKLSRSKFASQPDSLGLERVRDTDGQFFGFYSNIPDRSRTTGENGYTTMRSNCIACHSEQLYGPSTIFSLSRKQPATRGATAVVEGGKLERIHALGWRVNNADVGTIQKHLIALGK